MRPPCSHAGPATWPTVPCWQRWKATPSGAARSFKALRYCAESLPFPGLRARSAGRCSEGRLHGVLCLVSDAKKERRGSTAVPGLTRAGIGTPLRPGCITPLTTAVTPRYVRSPFGSFLRATVPAARTSASTYRRLINDDNSTTLRVKWVSKPWTLPVNTSSSFTCRCAMSPSRWSTRRNTTSRSSSVNCVLPPRRLPNPRCNDSLIPAHFGFPTPIQVGAAPTVSGATMPPGSHNPQPSRAPFS